MQNWRSSIIFAQTVLIVLICACKQKTERSEQGPKMLTKQQIIEIANKVAKTEGVLVKKSNVCYDEGNKEWEKTYVLLERESPEDAERLKILKGRDYQAVLYTPKSPTAMGGVLWVFIDRTTGRLITLYAEI